MKKAFLKETIIIAMCVSSWVYAITVYARQDDTRDIQNQLSSVISKLDRINQADATPQTLQAEDYSIRALRALQNHR